MSTERIEVEVREDGSRVVQRNLEEMARAAEVTAASLELMKSALNSIQGTVKTPTASLQQMRAAINALKAAANSPGGILNTNNMAFAGAALDRLRQSVNSFAAEAPNKVQAAIGRINLATGAIADQINRVTKAQSAIAGAQANMKSPPQGSFAFMNEPMKIQGQGWALEGTFKKTAAAAQEAAGTIASLTAPTQAFSNAGKAAAASAQQMSLNFGSMNQAAQSSFAFMAQMPHQVNQNWKQMNATVAQAAAPYARLLPPVQQLALNFNQAGQATAAAATAANGAAGAFGNLGKSIINARNAIRLYIAYLGVNQLKDYIDTWIGVENSVRLSTKSTAEAVAVQERLFEVAQRSRTPIDEMVRLYRRLAQVQGNLHATQNEMLDLTEGVGMAISVQGTKIVNARGALLQFGQAMGMARVRAQEFNAINENAPRILQGVANHIDGANGSIDKLRQIMIKGGLSGRQFFEAFMKELPKLREEFEKVRPTIGQAFAVLDNAIGRYIYQTDKSVGASTAFARAVIWVAENVDILVKALISLVSAAIIAGIATLIIQMGGMAAAANTAKNAIMAMWAALSAHPLVAVLSAIVAVGIALYQFRDDIKIVEAEGITLGDVWRGQWQMIMDGAKTAWDYIAGLWSNNPVPNSDPLLENIKKYQDMNGKPLINLFNAADQQKEMGFIQSLFMDWLNNQKQIVNTNIGLWKAFIETVRILWRDLFASMIDIAISSINTVIENVEKFVNRIILALNIIRAITGQDLIPEFDLPKITNVFQGRAQQMASDIRTAIKGALSEDYLGELFDGLMRRVREASKSRQFLAAGGLARPPNLNERGGGSDGDAGANDKLQKKLDHLRSTIDPVWAALHKIKEAEDLLNLALKAGLPLWDTKEKIMAQVRKHYEDALDPMGALVRKVQEEIDLNRADVSERRGGLEALRAEYELKKKLGRDLTGEEKAGLQGLFAEKRATEELARAREALYNRTIWAQRRYSVSQQVLNEALNKGWITLKEFHNEMAQMAVEAGQGTWMDGFITQLDVLDKRMSAWAQRTGQILGDTVNTFVDGISNAIGRAIVYGENFYDLMHKVGQEVLSTLISAFVKLGIQMLLNWALGKSLATASLAANTAMATATATAWAPAAAMVSLASWGANAAAATAAIVQTTTTASLLALTGYERGGYTGDLSRKQVAGLVHGQEFVVNADATKKYRGFLEDLNRGSTPTATTRSPGGSGTPGMRVTVNNYAGVDIETRQVSPEEVEIIARRVARDTVHTETPKVVAAQTRDPNSRISRSLGASLEAGRRRNG